MLKEITCPLRVDAGVNLRRRKAVLTPTFVSLVRTRIACAPYLTIRRIPMGSAFKDPVLSLSGRLEAVLASPGPPSSQDDAIARQERYLKH